MNELNMTRRCMAAFLLLSLFLVPASAADKPKAVSLDYCADQFLLSIADRDQILALTRDAVERHSFYRNEAEGLPLFNATSEEILQISPAIAVRYWGGARTLPFLKRANIEVATAGYGSDDKMLYKNMRLFGAALDQEQRVEEMILDYQARMANVKRKARHIQGAGQKLRAAYITPGGITAGENTFVSNVLKLAGLTPMSIELGLEGWQPLPLEALIRNPPDVIIGSFFDLDKLHVSNWSLSRHSRVKQMLDRIPTILVPGRYLSCNGIFSVDAAEYIQDHTEELFTAHPRDIAGASHED